MNEQDIKGQIIAYLRLRHIMVIPRNTGRLGGVRFGYVGAADLEGILPGGRHLEIEVKTVEGEQSGAQRAFQALVEQAGGLYVVARSVADVEHALKKIA